MMHEMIATTRQTNDIPRQNIQVCNAHPALARASEVFTTLEADVEYVVKTGGLVGVAWERVDKDDSEDKCTTHVSWRRG